MDSAHFTLVSAYDGPVHFNVKFCSGLRDGPARPSGNLSARGHAVQSSRLQRDCGGLNWGRRFRPRWPRRRRMAAPFMASRRSRERFREADRQAAPRRDPHPVRLARHRLGGRGRSAHAVREPKHVIKTGETMVLTSEQARELLDTIDVTTLVICSVVSPYLEWSWP